MEALFQREKLSHLKCLFTDYSRAHVIMRFLIYLRAKFACRGSGEVDRIGHFVYHS